MFSHLLWTRGKENPEFPRYCCGLPWEGENVLVSISAGGMDVTV